MSLKTRRPSTDNFEKYNINESITARTVRLVGEDGEPKVIATSEALVLAKQRALDLVEISPNQDPPVVKIVDYSKFRFEQLKKAKEAKKKQKVIHVKEIKMRPNIDKHDFEHKIKHAVSFFEKGDKVKFTLMFRGREMVHPELGFEVFKKIKEQLGDTVFVEKDAAQEGRNITMIVGPKAVSGKPKEQPK